MVRAKPNHSKEIRCRIGLGWCALCKHSLITMSKLSLPLKRVEYSQCVLPMMTYGAETWRLAKQLESESAGHGANNDRSNT